jgi:hypothetical protein
VPRTIILIGLGLCDGWASKAFKLTFGVNVERDVRVAGGMAKGDAGDGSVHDLGGCWTLHFRLEGNVW